MFKKIMSSIKNFFREIKKSKNNSQKRKIDQNVEGILDYFQRSYTIVPSREIKSWKSYLIITFVAGFCAALIWSAYISIYTTSEAEETAQVTLFTSVLSSTHKTGEEYTVDILLNTAGKNIVAVQVVGNYNKDNLEVKSIDTSNSGFNFEVLSNIDSGQGKIFIARAKPHPGVNTTEAHVATLNLKALRSFNEPSVSLKLSSMNAVDDCAAILDDGKGTNVLEKLSARVVRNRTDKDFFVIRGESLTDTIARIEWSEGPYTGKKYEIERKITGAADFALVGQIDYGNNYYVDRSLRAKKTYFYRICQTPDEGEKICTREVSLKTQKKKVITKPRLSYQNQEGKILVYWVPVYSTDFQIFLQRRGGGSRKFQTIFSTSSNEINSYLDAGILKGQKYEYKLLIRAAGKNKQESKVIKALVP